MFVDIHIHSPVATIDSVRYHRQLSSDEQFLFSTGVHPWDAHLFDKDEMSMRTSLSQIIAHPNFFMLGEIGLDFSKKDNLHSQIMIFEKQLQFANEYHVGIILIHCVRALNEVLKLAKQTKYNGIFIFHDANFNSIETEQVIKLGHYLSFGKNLFRNHSKASQSIKASWTKHYFFETDDSSHSIIQVYQKACELMNISIHDLQEQVQKNFQNLKKDRA